MGLFPEALLVSDATDGDGDVPSPTDGSFLPELKALCDTWATLTGVDGAAVATAISVNSRELVYATDAVAERIDELQFTVGDGPCSDAYTS